MNSKMFLTSEGVTESNPGADPILSQASSLSYLFLVFWAKTLTGLKINSWYCENK
jgi:hypothetical protein